MVKDMIVGYIDDTRCITGTRGEMFPFAPISSMYCLIKTHKSFTMNVYSGSFGYAKMRKIISGMRIYM
jgi:hypothetical protein